MAYVLNHWQNWALCAAILIAAAIVVARIVHYVVFFLLDRIARNPKQTLIASLSRHERTAAKWIFPLLAVLIVLPLLPIPELVQRSAAHVLGLALIASPGWVLVSVTGVIADIAYARYRIDVADNLSARRIRTQVQVLRRIVLPISYFLEHPFQNWTKKTANLLGSVYL